MFGPGQRQSKEQLLSNKHNTIQKPEKRPLEQKRLPLKPENLPLKSLKHSASDDIQMYDVWPTKQKKKNYKTGTN